MKGSSATAGSLYDELLRDGLIQRFTFSYELSHRMLRRYLRMVAASPDAFD